MDGFKNSTRTQYMKGGACEGYAKGGSVKGAAKIAKVMGEFKAGTLHSGSKKGPEVTSKKQATAIALSEARKAGAKIPVKKGRGGMIEEGISTRPTTASGRRMTNEELGMTPGGVAPKKMPPAVKGAASGAAKGLGARAASEAAKGLGARAARPLPKKAVPVAPREPLISPSLMREINMRSMAEKYGSKKGPATGLGAVSDSDMRMLRNASGYKKGGLSAMPKNKGGKC
jgi:hypothetical protein